MKERGIDKLLDEAREELKDSDSTYMSNKKCELLHLVKVLDGFTDYSRIGLLYIKLIGPLDFS